MSTSSFVRNHEPDQQGIWFEYTGFRFKDQYDVELYSGKVYKDYRPNGNSWYGRSCTLLDSQVKRIRLKPDAELEEGWDFTGKERIERLINLHGEKPNA